MNNSESGGHTERSEQATTKQQSQQVFFSLIHRVGSFGNYQKITILFWMAIIYFSGQILFSVPFLFFQDPYNCEGIELSTDCNNYVCGLDQSARDKYLTHITIRSLAGELGDYRCPSERGKLDDLIAIMFFGIAAGYLFLTLFGESVGKKMLMLINFALYICGIGVVLLFYEYWSAVACGMLVAVLGISNCYIICYIFLVETVQNSVRQKATVLINSFYGIGAIVNILWYLLFKDWKTIFFFCYLLPSAAIFIAMCFFLVDTPMSLILRNSSQFALKKMQFIARLNGAKNNITLQDIQNARLKHRNGASQGQKQAQKITVLQIFKYKSVRYLTVVLILLQCTISFQFYAPTMMLSSFHLDIYINGLALASSQVLANFMNVFLISRFNRRFLFFVCLGCILFSSSVLFLLWNQNSQEEASLLVNIAILVLLFMFQLSISEQYSVFFVFTSQAFPTQARVIAVSIISLMGGLMSTVTSKVVGLCLQNNFPVMVVFIMMTCVCIVIVCFLPQTFKTVPRDVIAQLEQDQISVDASTNKLLLD